MRYNLIEADILDALDSVEDNAYHACFCDPPYGLSDEPDMEEVLSHWLNGDAYEHSNTGFMSMTWDSFVPGPRVWREIERVVKPGGMVLTYGGTRTFDLLSLAHRLAHLERRDTLCWVNAQGFAKSHAIGKAIDKQAGDEFEESPAKGVGFMRPDGRDGYNVTKHQLHRIGESTPEAETWDGWGTALAPAWEPLLLSMVARDDTFANNALTHGVAGLNIDGARIPTGDSLGGGMVSKGRPKSSDGWDRPWMHDPEVTERKKKESAIKVAHAEKLGRWPSNFVLSHHPECEQVGTRKVKGHTGYPNGPGGKSMHYSDQESRGEEVRPDPWPGHADEDGYETVPVYDCHPDCPVKTLAEQSGVTRGDAPHRKPRINKGENNTCYDNYGQHHYTTAHTDSGTAARFYYCAKSSPSERDEGCDKLYWQKDESRDSGWRQVGREVWQALDEGEKTRGNFHPTCKPLSLNEYMATLILPPEQEEPRKLLVPFCGSGSEIIGALRAGWDEVTGIDMVSDYLTIAKARLGLELARGRQTKLF